MIPDAEVLRIILKPAYLRHEYNQCGGGQPGQDVWAEETRIGLENTSSTGGKKFINRMTQSDNIKQAGIADMDLLAAYLEALSYG